MSSDLARMTTKLGNELLGAGARQAESLRHTEHRPWPVPAGPWVMGQTWRDLLFAHWQVPLEKLRRTVPATLPIDTFDGGAWLAVTPLRMDGVRARATLPLPRVSRFLELNVRTYVTLGGKPGVYFFSLDASTRLGVESARALYKLPYFHARMSAAATGDGVRFTSLREDGRAPRAELRVTYAGGGDAFQPRPGSLEHFLTERYCLYAVDRGGRVLRAEIHHAPWSLRNAKADFGANTMAPPGVQLSGGPLLHVAERQDVVVWLPMRVGN